MTWILIVFFSMQAPAVTAEFSTEDLCNKALIEVIKEAQRRTVLTATPSGVCVQSRR